MRISNSSRLPRLTLVAGCVTLTACCVGLVGNPQGMAAYAMAAGTTEANNTDANTTSSTAATTEEDAKALKTLRSSRWYDPSTGAFRPPTPTSDPDHPLRTAGRLAAPPAPTTTTRNNVNLNWLSGLGNASLFWPAVIIMAIVILALLFGLGFISVRGGGWRKSQSGKKAKEIEIDPAKIVELPFESTAVSSDPLAQARALAAARRFEEATLFLYGYMLLALDRATLIHLHRGKTNRMYLRELSGRRTVRSIVEATMLAFEDVFFGRHAISEARFLTYWKELDRFHTEIAQATAAQAAAETSAMVHS